MISVAIVDDQRDVRDGLRKLLDSTDGFSCTGAYADGKSAIEGIRAAPPKVVLMDVDLPDTSGIECVRTLKQEMPELDVIMLTAYTDDESIFQALKAGAYGYLTKNIFPSRLLSAIQEICSGGAPMSSFVARRVVSSFSHFNEPESSLSNREKDVLDLLCEGYSYKSIADKLFVSTNTVRFHLKNIYKKLQVNSRHEAVMKANRLGAA